MKAQITGNYSGFGFELRCLMKTTAVLYYVIHVKAYAIFLTHKLMCAEDFVNMITDKHGSG